MLDKEKLYGLFMESYSAKRKRNDLAIRKGLDLPIDDEVIVDNRRFSFGSSPFFYLLSSSMIFAGGYFLGQGIQDTQDTSGPNVPVVVEPAVESEDHIDTDTQYKIRLVDPPDDG